MIYQYTYGTPFETDAVISSSKKLITKINTENINTESNKPNHHLSLTVDSDEKNYGTLNLADGFSYTYHLEADDIVYGLGQANRGINKRGYIYISDCFDNPHHTEDQCSFYGAHNFLIIDGSLCFGLFFDYPSKITFDICYTHFDTLKVTCDHADLDLYLITGNSSYDIVKQFRKIIGRSYIPPKFAFGYGQSRWGYQDEHDYETVVNGYRNHHIPIDMVYMDIDYMDKFKDFTIDKKKFPNFDTMVSQMRDQNIHLIPIIDAGVKIESDYSIYEEGKAKDYFCKRADGSDFEAAVWPGLTHFVDVLNPNARKWFGSKYKILVDKGINGFWNDMCEPAIFYTPEGIAEYKDYLQNELLHSETFPDFEIHDRTDSLQNNPKDYQRFYHNVNGHMVRHDTVHNLYGMNMTRAASEGLKDIAPEKRMLLFSRSSYIGAHRYGGIWTGDNQSWWSHILLNLKMMPSLNMCGFLYCGADLGGFGSNTTRDLLLRWLALGVFMPLMRNHAALGTRKQECYQFEHIEDFRHIINVRYRLIPYLYSEFMKAALHNDMYCRPLAFDYPKDSIARQIEDQIFIGNEIMIAPVYTQNTTGRYVYLPEEMKFIKFLPNGTIYEETLSKGHHYVEIALNEVPLFIRNNQCIPIVDAAENVEDISMDTLQWIGYTNAHYELYEDDGISPIPENNLM